MKICNVEIIQNKKINENVYEMNFYLEDDILPGQFVNIKIDDSKYLLRRPISIANYENGICTLAYKVIGDGTKIMSSKKPGDTLNIISSLGNGFPLKERKKCLLIAGGIGIPPMIYLAKELKKKSCQITSLIGFREKEQIIYHDELKKYGNVIIATDDGSEGFHGNIIDCLKNTKLDFDILYACGPTVLLKNLDEMFYNKKEGYISFEERMACGIGACYGCACKTKDVKDGTLRVCKEGPVFELGVINYD